MDSVMRDGRRRRMMREDLWSDAPSRREPSDQRAAGAGGMRTVFWTWMGIVVVGLVAMIAVPLGGA